MTILFVALISIVSILAFNNKGLFYKLQFNPYQIVHRKQFYRVFSHVLVHADWTHLIVNMLVLYSFGRNVEFQLKYYSNAGFIDNPMLIYAVFLFLGMIVSSISTLLKNKNNPQYNSVGASGVVSAVVFMSIFFSPLDKIYFYLLIPIPGIAFGALYLIYTQYMNKKNSDNINHDAHFYGALFGFIFPILLNFDFINEFLKAFHII